MKKSPLEQDLETIRAVERDIRKMQREIARFCADMRRKLRKVSDA